MQRYRFPMLLTTALGLTLLSACGSDTQRKPKVEHHDPLDMTRLTVPTTTTVTDEDIKAAQETPPAEVSAKAPEVETPTAEKTTDALKPVGPLPTEPQPVDPQTEPRPVDPQTPQEPVKSPAQEEPFCVDRKAGECLTVVLRIPSAELESSLGISTMNLMQVSKNFDVAIKEACNEGLGLYTDTIVPAGRVKEDTISRVKESRCLVDFIKEEGQPLPVLSSKEIGYAVRLVDFNIIGETRITKPPFVTVSLDNAKFKASIRDPKIFSIPKGETAAKWRPIRGNHTIVDQITGVPNDGIFGTADIEFNFNASLAVRFDGDRSIEFLNSVFKNNPTTGETPAQAVTGFLTQASQALSSLGAASGVVPQVGAVVVLVSLGVDAIRYVCHQDGVDCSISRTEQQAVENIRTQMGNTNVDAHTKAMFMDGMKHFPAGIVETIFANANTRDLWTKLNYR